MSKDQLMYELEVVYGSLNYQMSELLSKEIVGSITQWL